MQQDSPIEQSPDEGRAALLAGIMLEFATSLDLEETLQHAVTRIANYLQAEAASIFLLDDTGRTLICRKCTGPVDICGLTLSAEEGIVGASIAGHSIQLVRDAREHQRFAAGVDANTGFVTRSILCLPLVIGERCIGALELLNKRGGDGLFAHADGRLAAAVAAGAALAIHNARMAQALVEQERVRRELELARVIQLGLLPEPSTALPIHGINVPARTVSGDFYDFCTLPDGRIYFCVADVAGKGMNAALLMAKTTSLLRCLAKESPDPSTLLSRVNAEICETASRGMFVTIVAGFVESRRRRIVYANAGHHPPLQRRGRGRYASRPASSAPLGVLAGLQPATETLSLVDGDIYLFTDGVIEARDRARRELGVPGLEAILDEVHAAPADRRLSAVLATLEAQQRDFHDDLTMLLIERDGG
jgi:sigma-B regulation protein RsbU (phosphoserine phosphatase)